MLVHLTSQRESSEAARLFISYSHKDEDMCQTLIEHLSPLKEAGRIDTWYDRKISPGKAWEKEIDQNLESANIVLLLISKSFIASRYCYSIEMKRALEKYKNGELRVIPIILRPVFWRITPLANLLALPKDGRPVIKYRPQDEAFAQIAESIFDTVQEIEIHLNSGASISIALMLWRLKVSARIGFEDQARIDQIIDALKKMADSDDISLNAIDSGDETTLILSGSEKTFGAIDQAFKDGDLQNRLDIPVVSFTQVYGAGVKHSAFTVEDSTLHHYQQTHKADLLQPSVTEFTPMLLKGLQVDKHIPERFNFTVDTGHEELTKAQYTREIDRQIHYFKAALTIPEALHWVNLSPYEDNRMLPQVLSETLLGRDLLLQDCHLKKFTASLMHPDTQCGAKYWNTVYEKLGSLSTNANDTISSYHKVWIVPEIAKVYDGPLDNINSTDFFTGDPVNNSTETQEGAYIIENYLNVMCETDYLALKQGQTAQRPHPDQEVDICYQAFKEHIVPVIEKEVNSGKHFVRLRQMYHAMILAVWYKKAFKEREDRNRWIDTGNPAQMQVTIYSDSDKGETIPSRFQNTFDSKETTAIYKAYLALFSQGVFKCVRKRYDPVTQRFLNQVYVSGCIDLRHCNITGYKL